MTTSSVCLLVLFTAAGIACLDGPLIWRLVRQREEARRDWHVMQRARDRMQSTLIRRLLEHKERADRAELQRDEAIARAEKAERDLLPFQREHGAGGKFVRRKAAE